MPDEARKQQRTAGLRHQAEAGERHDKPRRPRRDHQIGVGQHRGADTDGGAVDRRDQRSGQRRQCIEERRCVRGLVRRRARLKILDIVAGGEGVAGAAEQDHPDCRIFVGAMEGIGNRGVHRLGEGVFLLRPVEQDFQDGAGLGDENVAHDVSCAILPY